MPTLLRQRLERVYDLDGKRYEVVVDQEQGGIVPRVEVYHGPRYVHREDLPEALNLAIDEWLVKVGAP